MQNTVFQEAQNGKKCAQETNVDFHAYSHISIKRTVLLRVLFEIFSIKVQSTYDLSAGTILPH